ncbi:MAG: PpiC-type peptidyl-prolyl cis-trans isomerase [candidate division TM6 bacterium GW2011_GWF2_32_72]|nr:MAG: PpiC-type peptidyl-prolyl cis-trans isomerase [candidate division TM6 bacterium GW2011_GWF2_32_72]
MISYIRRGMQNEIVYKVIVIGSVAFLIIAWYILPMFDQKRKDYLSQTVVTVNGSSVPLRELKKKSENIQNQISAMRQAYGAVVDNFLKHMGLDKNPETAAMNHIIRQELMAQSANSIPVNVNPDFATLRLFNPFFVAKELADIVPYYQIMDQYGKLDMDALKSFLQQRQMTWSDFEKELQKRVAVSIAKNLVENAFYTPKFDLDLELIAQNQEKDFTILTFPISKYVNELKSQKLDEAALDRFYKKQNKDSKKYLVPEKRDGNLWSFDIKEYNALVSNEDIEKYYDKVKRSKYMEAPAKIKVRRILFTVDEANPSDGVRTKAESLRQEILIDKSKFAEFAKQYSADKETAKKGGLIEFFERGSRDPNFEKAAFILQEDGDVSAVTETKDGLEIIQRISKKNPEYKPLEKVKAEIRDLLAVREFKQAFAQDISRVLDSENFVEFANSKKAKKEFKKGISKDGSQIAQRLFRVSSIGERAYFVDVENKKGVVVELANIDKSYTPELKDVEALVKEDYYQEKAKTLLEENLKKAKAMSFTKSISEVAKEFRVSETKTGFVLVKKASENSVLKKLEDQGITVSSLFLLDQKGAVKVFEGPQSGLLVKLEGTKLVEKSDQNPSLKEIEAGQEQSYRQIGEASFVASLYRNAKIDIDNTLYSVKE